MSSRQPHFMKLKSLTFNLIDSRPNEGLSVRFPSYPSTQQLCPGGLDREAGNTKEDRQTDGQTAQRKDVTSAGSDNHRC